MATAETFSIHWMSNQDRSFVSIKFQPCSQLCLTDIPSNMKIESHGRGAGLEAHESDAVLMVKRNAADPNLAQDIVLYVQKPRNCRHGPSIFCTRPKQFAGSSSCVPLSLRQQIGAAAIWAPSTEDDKTSPKKRLFILSEHSSSDPTNWGHSKVCWIFTWNLHLLWCIGCSSYRMDGGWARGARCPIGPTFGLGANLPIDGIPCYIETIEKFLT